MNIDQSANFLVGSILFGLGLVIIVATIVVINNIIYRYWKSLGWFKGWFEHRQYILSEDEYNKIAPHLDAPSIETKDKKDNGNKS